MKRGWVTWFMLALVLGGLRAPAAHAQSEQTMRGEIVDPASYLKDGRHGPSFVDQTYEALDGGQTLALLEDTTGTLYLLLAEEPGEDPNELIYDYVNQSLTVHGTVYERSGLRGIVLHSIEPIEPAEPTEAGYPADGGVAEGSADRRSRRPTGAASSPPEASSEARQP